MPTGVVYAALRHGPAIGATVATVTTQFLGNGLGRRFEQDFITQSVKIAQAFPNQAVKLIWPRRQDFANDQYRPMALANVKAGLDGSGKIVAFRLAHLGGSPRHAAVLEAAVTLAGWGGSLAAGHAHGLALSDGFGSIVAQVSEISQPTPGVVKVHRVACAIDCGLAVHPDQVAAQMEGGIVHGLTAALWGKMTFTNGAASPLNYDGYRMLRMNEMPRIDVTIVNSGGPIGGVGEPGTPPIAPAVANAWMRLTGQRKRSLPLF